MLLLEIIRSVAVLRRRPHVTRNENVDDAKWENADVVAERMVFCEREHTVGF